MKCFERNSRSVRAYDTEARTGRRGSGASCLGHTDTGMFRPQVGRGNSNIATLDKARVTLNLSLCAYTSPGKEIVRYCLDLADKLGGEQGGS